jgi:hypothetical protein
MIEVVVGNIGTVYVGRNHTLAGLEYDKYVDISKAGAGRGADEPVTLLSGDEILREYIPLDKHNVDGCDDEECQACNGILDDKVAEIQYSQDVEGT